MTGGLSGIGSPGDKSIRERSANSRVENLTGTAFKQLVEQHMDEIGRSQVAYQQYVKHGRADLAQGAHVWANQQRNRLEQTGLGLHLYEQDLSARFKLKNQPEKAPVYDYALPGRQLRMDGSPSIAKGSEAYRMAAAAVKPIGGLIESAPPEIKEWIIKAAGQVGLDANLIASVAYRESRFKDRARSEKGAIGLLQLMPETAEKLGVDPFEPYSNIYGGAKYLKDHLQKYDGDLNLALAAYNAGPGRVDEAIRRAGNTTDWDAVSPFLPEETQKYVISVLGTYS